MGWHFIDTRPKVLIFFHITGARMHLTQVDGTSLDGKEAVTEGDLFKKKKKKKRKEKKRIKE